MQGQLASSGLRRSGEGISQAADIGSDLALQIEQLLFGRNVNLAGSGQNAAAGLGAFGQTAAQDQASLLGQQGAISANTLLGLSQNRQQSGQNIATGLAAIFSDPRLKDNLRIVGKFNELDLYEWDWKPEFNDTIVAMCPKIGFISTQVKEFYPEYVGSFGGFDTIDYPGLMEVL